MKNAPKLCSTDVAILMQEKYETAYGLYNHDVANVDRPLALVALHPDEDSTTGSLLYERIQEYRESQVLKYFGISLDKFLDLPTDIVLFILEESNKSKNLENTVTADAMKKLQDEISGKT